MIRSHRQRRLSWILSVVVLATACLVGIVGCSSARPPAPAAVDPPGAGGAAGTAAPPVAPAQPTASRPDPTTTPVPTVAPATQLTQQTTNGKALAASGWAVNGVVLSFRVPALAGQALIPQVEVVKADQAFKGTPTTEGPPVPAANDWVQAQIALKDLVPGQYKWQARFANAETKQQGAWAAFAGGGTGFGIVGGAPSIQSLTVTGTSHVVGGVPAASKQDQPGVQWSVSTDEPIALDHLAYLVDHQKESTATVPANATALAPGAQNLPLANLDDGQWYVHLWAMDKAGQTGAPATVAVTMMRNPPAISDVLYRSWVTNPLYQTVPISFSLSRDAKIQVSILPDKSATAIRVYDLGQQSASKGVHLNWDGKDAQGKIVAPGSYRFLVDAVDVVGNENQALYNGITVTDKVIKVSLGTQTLTAYEGDKPLLTTLVTTGGADIPTPIGKFEILQKSAPFTFHSPFPKGNKFWYPDVTSQHAMLFDQPDADFIHDAPWRNKFGPGTNGPGVPGQVYTGSHGCVETPASVMPRLFPWTPLGTPVIVAR